MVLCLILPRTLKLCQHWSLVTAIFVAAITAVSNWLTNSDSLLKLSKIVLYPVSKHSHHYPSPEFRVPMLFQESNTGCLLVWVINFFCVDLMGACMQICWDLSTLAARTLPNLQMQFLLDCLNIFRTSKIHLRCTRLDYSYPCIGGECQLHSSPRIELQNYRFFCSPQGWLQLFGFCRSNRTQMRNFIDQSAFQRSGHWKDRV